jgi:hypothetical protein
VAFQEQLENQLDLLRLDRIDDEFLLDPRPAPFRFHRAVPKRGPRTVPEPLAGILFHRAQDMLGVLLRLVFVKQRDHLPHHHLRRLVAQLLRDRHQPHAMLGEPAHVEFEAEGITEEARERVHDDHVKGVLAITGAFDHALELRSLVVGRRRAVDVFSNDPPTALPGPSLRLGPLVRD